MLNCIISLHLTLFEAFLEFLLDWLLLTLFADTAHYYKRLSLEKGVLKEIKLLIWNQLGKVTLIAPGNLFKFVLLHLYVKPCILNFYRKLLEVYWLNGCFIFLDLRADSLTSWLWRGIHILRWYCGCRTWACIWALGRRIGAPTNLSWCLAIHYWSIWIACWSVGWGSLHRVTRWRHSWLLRQRTTRHHLILIRITSYAWLSLHGYLRLTLHHLLLLHVLRGLDVRHLLLSTDDLIGLLINNLFLRLFL